MRSELTITIQQIAHHRNGVGGEPFYAVLFNDSKEGLMVASVFEGSGQVSVLRVLSLSAPDVGVTFGQNSWRGDRYEPLLRKAIREWEVEQDRRWEPT